MTDSGAQTTGKWPIFICYRQADGHASAARIFALLDEQIVPVAQGGAAGEGPPPPVLDVYYDQAAPGVSDWTAVHEPFLKRARAMILICTPGAKLHEGPDDWVHHEIDWWLQNRAMAPILVDPLGQDLRYVPDGIARKWPNAQRIRMRESDWDGQDAAGRQALADRLREQFIGAIVPSVDAFYRQELDEENARTQKLRRTRWTLALVVMVLVAVLGAAGWIFVLKQQADQARAAAQLAQQGELAARELAEARLIENQSVRAATEARLFGYLRQFPQFDAYADRMGEWQEDFQRRADELRREAQGGLPTCTREPPLSVYEGQLIGHELDRENPNEYLWLYLAVVPGQSTRPGDWTPAGLDAFIAPRDAITGGRELDRATVKKRIKDAGVPKGNVWSFVVGLAGGNYFRFNGTTYKISYRNLRSNDDGDFIMFLNLCREEPIDLIEVPRD